MELRRFGAECIPGYERGMLDPNLKITARTGGPHAAVLGAKRAVAGTGHNLDRVWLQGKGEGDIPAVAGTMNQHESGLRCDRTVQLNSGGGRQCAVQLCRSRVVNPVEYPTIPDL